MSGTNTLLPEFSSRPIYFPDGRMIHHGTFVVFKDEDDTYGGNAIMDVPHISIGRILKEAGTDCCVLNIYKLTLDGRAELRGYKTIEQTDEIDTISKNLIDRVVFVFVYEDQSFMKNVLGRQGCEHYFVVVAGGNLESPFCPFPCDKPLSKPGSISNVKSCFIDFVNLINAIDYCLGYSGTKSLFWFSHHRTCSFTNDGWELLLMLLQLRHNNGGFSVSRIAMT